MSTQAVSELRLRMIEDMKARQLNKHTQRSHIYSCKRFAAYLKRSPETATADEVRAFQLYLIETGPSICNRNRIMTGVKFLLRVTLRRHDLASEIYYVREPQKLPLVMSPAEAKRLLAMADNLKVKVMLTLCYGCGLRAGEVAASRLATSTVSSRSSASCRPRAAKTVMLCCRPKFLICCDNGGRCGPRGTMKACR